MAIIIGSAEKRRDLRSTRRIIREALRAFFHPERLPTSTWIGVAALANPDFLIEIEATAVIE